MRNVKVMVLAGALALAPLASAFAGDYVLVASNWGSKQAEAVAAAGGTVQFAHGQTGIGVVTSSAPDFLDRALASNAFHYGALDEAIQWQNPLAAEQLALTDGGAGITEAVVNPANDTFYPIQWAHAAVESPAAWAAGCTGDGVRVAVLDGGIYSAHPDLDANLDIACSRSFHPATTNPFTDTGTFWHGTHVTGIIAAEDNNVGVVGIAPDATIMGVKVLHSGSGPFGSIISGILYAADPAAFGAAGCARADIINMSLGAVFPKNGLGSLVSALNRAVNFAASKGVLVVSAAGNNGADFGQLGNFTTVPADSGSGLAVSATGPLAWAYGATNYTRPASYSNYGEGLIFVAGPGGDSAYPGNENCTLPVVGGTVTVPCWVFDLYLSTSRGTSVNGGYSWAAGTSMATPAASAVAALILGNNPGLSLGALKARLHQSSVDDGPIGHDEFYGHGFINARRACEQ